MTSLQIIPEKKDEKTNSCEPCCPPCEEKPRFPRVCFEGTALDAFENEAGVCNVDDEIVLTNVRVRVVGKSHTEWRRDIDLALVGFEGAEPDGSDAGESGGESPMERAIQKASVKVRGAKMPAGE